MEDVLKQAISASLRELQVLEATLPEGVASFYAKARILYLQSRINELEALIDSTGDSVGSDMDIAVQVSRVRIAVRRGTNCSELISSLLQLARDPWRGEIFVVVAMYYEVHQDDTAASEFYLKAYKQFQSESLPAKAAVAYHNRISAQKRLSPNRLFHYEYEHAYQIALEAKEFGIAGIALTNLACEYQTIGALRPALRTVNLALSTLTRDYFGSYQYYMSLCLRCELHLHMGNIESAMVDYEEAAISELPEINFVLTRLKSKFPEPPTLEPRSKATIPVSPWQAGPLRQLSTQALSDTESRLVTMLVENPRSKFDLIEILYPHVKDIFEAENRLKQLLHRLRKKAPKIIVYEDGLYKITAPSI